MNTLGKLTAVDTRIFFWFSGYSQKRLIELCSRGISRSGDGYLYLFIGIALALTETDGVKFLTAGIMAFALELPLYWILKNTIQRDRPCHRIEGFNAIIQPSDRFSFPSGHTAAAFLFATLIAVFYPFFAICGFIFAVLVGMSRVLLGVHYPTDILAGALLGTLSTLPALWFLGLI